MIFEWTRCSFAEDKAKRVARGRLQLKHKFVALRAALNNKTYSRPGSSREEKAEALQRTKEKGKRRQAHIRAWRIRRGDKLRQFNGITGVEGVVDAAPSGVCAAALD